MAAKPLTPEQQADAERLAAALALAKRERNITQARLAHECGWETQSTISQYVRGKIPLNVEALARMCKVLDVPMESISPSLARQHQELSALIAALPKPATAAAPAPAPTVLHANERRGQYPAWPFAHIPADEYFALSEHDRERIEDFAEWVVFRRGRGGSPPKRRAS